MKDKVLRLLEILEELDNSGYLEPDVIENLEAESKTIRTELFNHYSEGGN